MSTSFRKTFFIFLLATIHFFLFWNAYLGVNMPIFSIVVVGVLFLLHREEWESPSVKVAAVGTLLSAITIVWHNSYLAYWAHYISFLLLIGFIQSRELRFIWFGLLLGLRNILASPFDFFKQILLVSGEKSKVKFSMRWISIGLLPIILAGVFFALYHQANSTFTTFVLAVWKNAFILFFKSFSIFKIIFFFFGLCIATAVIRSSKLVEKLLSIQYLEDIKRVRKRIPYVGILSLKSEYQAAVLSFGMLNTLLLMVNFFDLPLLWMDYSSKSYTELKDFVHQGTYILIFSILLAMGIILFFFRKNLNFFPNNKMLKALAIAWCVQNAWLVFTVGFRNMQYIWHTGLAYKRIGVLFFLALTLFGLWTMTKKIKEKKSIPILFHWNAWAAYALLISSSFINWDIVITKHNLNQASELPLDLPFLVDDVSNKNLYLLYENKEKIAKNLGETSSKIEKKLAYKKSRFLKKQNRKDWRGWNWSDQRNANYFKE